MISSDPREGKRALIAPPDHVAHPVRIEVGVIGQRGKQDTNKGLVEDDAVLRSTKKVKRPLRVLMRTPEFVVS